MVMKIRFKGESFPFGLTNGHVYDVLSNDDGDMRIVDDTGDDYMYFLEPDEFEVVEEMAMV